MSSDRRNQPSDRRRPALIVSANPDTVDLYVLSLRNARTAVLSVGAVDEALHLLRDRSVSAIVMDIASPAHDWDACRLLISAAEPGLPVIVLTGWTDAATRDQAFDLGCAAFLAKPASPEQLGEVLHRTRAGERGIVMM
jgi:DNA-binding response OmpR family regulator